MSRPQVVALSMANGYCGSHGCSVRDSHQPPEIFSRQGWSYLPILRGFHRHNCRHDPRVPHLGQDRVQHSKPCVVGAVGNHRRCCRWVSAPLPFIRPYFCYHNRCWCGKYPKSTVADVGSPQPSSSVQYPQSRKSSATVETSALPVQAAMASTRPNEMVQTLGVGSRASVCVRKGKDR